MAIRDRIKQFKAVRERAQNLLEADKERAQNLLVNGSFEGIRSRAEADMRTERSGGPSGSRRPGFAVEYAEDKAVEVSPPGMGEHL